MHFIKCVFVLFVFLLNINLFANTDDKYTVIEYVYGQTKNEVSSSCVDIMAAYSTESTNPSKNNTSIEAIEENFTKVFDLVDKLYEGVVAQNKEITYEDVDVLTYIYWTVYYHLSGGNRRLFNYIFSDPSEKDYFLRKPYNEFDPVNNVLIKKGSHYKTDIESFRKHFEWGRNIIYGMGLQYWKSVSEDIKKFSQQIKHFSNGIDDTNIDEFLDFVLTFIKYRKDFLASNRSASTMDDPSKRSSLDYLTIHIHWLHGGIPLDSLDSKDFINEYSFFYKITPERIAKTIEKYVDDPSSIDKSLSLDFIGMHLRSLESSAASLFDIIEGLSDTQFMAVMEKLVTQDSLSEDKDLLRRYFLNYFMDSSNLQKKLQESKNSFIFWLYTYCNLTDKKQAYEVSDKIDIYSKNYQNIDFSKLYNTQIEFSNESNQQIIDLVSAVFSGKDNVDEIKQKYFLLSIEDKIKVIWFFSNMEGLTKKNNVVAKIVIEDLLNLRSSMDGQDKTQLENLEKVVFGSNLIKRFTSSVDDSVLSYSSSEEEQNTIRKILRDNKLESTDEVSDRFVAIISSFLNKDGILTFQTIQKVVWSLLSKQDKNMEEKEVSSVRAAVKNYLKKMEDKGFIVKLCQLDNATLSIYKLSDWVYEAFDQASTSESTKIILTDRVKQFIEKTLKDGGKDPNDVGFSRMVSILSYLVEHEDATRDELNKYLKSLLTKYDEKLSFSGLERVIPELKKLGLITDTSKVNFRRYVLTKDFKQQLEKISQSEEDASEEDSVEESTGSEKIELTDKIKDYLTQKIEETSSKRATLIVSSKHEKLLLLCYMLENGAFNSSAATNYLNDQYKKGVLPVSIKRVLVSKDLEELTKAGLVEKVGSSRNIKYQLSESLRQELNRL